MGILVPTYLVIEVYGGREFRTVCIIDHGMNVEVSSWDQVPSVSFRRNVYLIILVVGLVHALHSTG